MKCQSENIVAFDSPEGVTVDFCRKCGSIWFEQGELAFYVETESDIPALEDSLKLGRETTIGCSTCKDAHLVEIPYITSENLLVDICTQCKGVFLDAKEIVKVEALVKKYKLTRLGKILEQLKHQGYQIMKVKKLK